MDDVRAKFEGSYSPHPGARREGAGAAAVRARRAPGSRRCRCHSASAVAGSRLKDRASVPLSSGRGRCQSCSACWPSRDRARVLAGGTDLLVRLRLGHIRPAVVVDLKDLERLQSDIVDRGRRAAASARRAVMTDIIADARVRRHFPALVEAASVVGSVQIRNRATLAGNICNASPAADTAPALLVYGATVNLLSAAGVRHVPLAEFFTGPGRTVLTAGELVESIDLPIPARTGRRGVRPGDAAARRRPRDDQSVLPRDALRARRGSPSARSGRGPFVVEDASGALGGCGGAADGAGRRARPAARRRPARSPTCGRIATIARPC